MMFEGDLFKYGEFDNIGCQVLDDLERFICLFVECDGKVRDGIKSWCNFFFGNRYSVV